MRTKHLLVILLSAFMLLGAAGSSPAWYDAPHNDSNSISCSDCHTSNWPQDVTCLLCHNSDTGGGYSKMEAPMVLGHSSATTSTKYGTWSTMCKDCHYPHDQPRVSHGSQTYLATAIVTSITDNGNGTTTYGYSNLTVFKPEWASPALWGNKSGSERGLILVFDADNPISGRSGEIRSATAASITVTGAPPTLTDLTLTGRTFALVYGQYVGSKPDPNPPNYGQGTIMTPSGVRKVVKFFNNTGPNSFAFSEAGPPTDPVVDSVCQVCHTKTSHWRSDGSLAAIGVHAGQNGSDCMVCHPHEQGFSASGACNSCHGFPPITNTLGGPDGLVSNEGGTGSASPGSHARHATTAGQNYSCETCHTGGMPASPIYDKIIQISFNTFGRTSGTYDGRTTLANGYTYGPGVTQGGSQSCSTTYCHSNGTAVITGTVSANTTPAWTTTITGCTACHSYGPSYVNNSPKRNSHQQHASETCDTCHFTTTNNGTTISSPASHANGVYNADPNTGAGITFSYTQSSGSCSNISCHGGNTATWGGTVNCQDCHLAGTDLDDFVPGFYTNNITATVGAGEWGSTGHGRPSGTYTSGNAAAGFTTANACLFCHDNAVLHGQATNPFRLRNITDGNWGKNGNCQLCHAAGSAGVTVDGILKNGSKKVGSTHYGTKHGAANNGGQFCWDCHDPHGDTNIFMVHAKVAKTSDTATGAPTTMVNASFTAFATGTDYAGGSNSTKICNTCHTTTNHYTSTTSDTHNAAIRCTQCHKHTGDLKTDAFKPSGDDCFDCHSSAGGPTPGTVPDANHAKHIQTAYVGKVSTNDYGNYAANQWYRQGSTAGKADFGCGHCHPQSSATHMNGVINLNLSPTDTGAAGTVKAKNGTPPVFTQNSKVSVTCSSVYCHSDGYLNGSAYGYKTTPNWYGGSFAGDRCSACHGNSPSGSPTHGKHVVGIHYKDIYKGPGSDATGGGLAAAGNTPTGSHGNAATSTTINCNVCHASTVSSPANDKNPVCAACHTGASLKGTMVIASTSTAHVNGVPDVMFAAGLVRSKAQVRDDITTVPDLNISWVRQNGYKQANSHDLAQAALLPSYTAAFKSCSSVSCHNNNAVKWTDSVSCESCHTALPQ